MNRRVFLRSLGVAGLGLAGASIWRLESNHVLRARDGPAYAPWAEWRQAGTKPLEQLVRAAVLAANPHNTQPWKFHVLPDGVDIYADTSRRIGAIDPLLREMHIGVGCVIENLLLAAEAAGYRWSFDNPESSTESEFCSPSYACVSRQAQDVLLACTPLSRGGTPIAVATSQTKMWTNE